LIDTKQDPPFFSLDRTFKEKYPVALDHRFQLPTTSQHFANMNLKRPSTGKLIKYGKIKPNYLKIYCLTYG